MPLLTSLPFEGSGFKGIDFKCDMHAEPVQYDEINVATVKVVGNPGFTIAPILSVTHAQMPGVATHMLQHSNELKRYQKAIRTKSSSYEISWKTENRNGENVIEKECP